MLEQNANNRLALEVKQILDGEMQCDKDTAEQCYKNGILSDFKSINNCLFEIKEKIPNYMTIPFMDKTVKELSEKIGIYGAFLDWLKQ